MTPSPRRGFSLLEMLVTTGIMVLVLAGGLVTYRRFDDRQQLSIGGKQLVSELRKVQKRAQSGERVSECVSGGSTVALDSWNLDLVANQRTMRMYARCGQILGTYEEVSLPIGVFPTQSRTITFEVLSGLVSNGSGTITLSQVGAQTSEYLVLVTAAGGIIDEGVNRD